MRLRLQDVLKLPELRDVAVRAGSAGLTREISSVNIIDAPDIIPWARKGELMLTTGYVFRDSEEIQEQVISGLAKAKCAGLGIKTKRYFELIPAKMQEVADRWNFPLLELPHNLSLSQLALPIYREILNRQAAVLQKSLDIHYSFTQVVLTGGGIPEISQNLYTLLKCPLAVLDPAARVLVVKGEWQPFIQGNIPVENRVMPQLHKYLDQETAAMATGGQVLDVNELPGILVFPIAAGQERLGFLLLSPGERKLTELDLAAVNHGETVLALDRIKAKAVNEAKKLQRANFFDDLLAGKIESASEMLNRGAIHGLDLAYGYTCVLLSLENFSKLRLEEFQDQQQQLWNVAKKLDRLAKSVYQHQDQILVTAIRGNKVICFLPHAVAKDENSDKQEADSFMAGFMAAVRKTLPEITVIAASGRFYPHLLEVHKSFGEANEALDLLRKLKRGSYGHFDDFMVYHLLSTGTVDQLRDYCRRTVCPLRDYDRERGTNLTDTLEQYLASRGNVTEAAKELFIHRNTLLYRLEKIKQVLGVGLESSEQLLELQLGLKAMRLLEINGKQPD